MNNSLHLHLYNMYRISKKIKELKEEYDKYLVEIEKLSIDIYKMKKTVQQLLDETS
jgi:hypothetical protein